MRRSVADVNAHCVARIADAEFRARSASLRNAARIDRAATSWNPRMLFDGDSRWTLL